MLKKWQTLFTTTQALPAVKDISDADIATEIEIYRADLMQQSVRDAYTCRILVDSIESPTKEDDLHKTG